MIKIEEVLINTTRISNFNNGGSILYKINSKTHMMLFRKEINQDKLLIFQEMVRTKS